MIVLRHSNFPTLILLLTTLIPIILSASIIMTMVMVVVVMMLMMQIMLMLMLMKMKMMILRQFLAELIRDFPESRWAGRTLSVSSSRIDSPFSI